MAFHHAQAVLHMDSKHRHELEQNDLQAFFTHFGSWWEKHGTRTLLIVLIVSGVLVGATVYRQSVDQTLNAAWTDLAANEEPNGLRAVASEHDLPEVQALAQLGAADVFLKNALTETDADKKQQMLRDAADLYDQAMHNQEVHKVYRFNAMLGRASIAESMKDWDAARSHYETLIAQADQYPVILSLAKGRLSMLDQIQQPVVLGPDPEPAPESTETDAKTNAEPDTNPDVDADTNADADKPADPSAPSDQSAAPAKDQSPEK